MTNMKFGARKPSLKKSISARTRCRATRTVKKIAIPAYGEKGSGWVKNPKQATYNKVYNEATIDLFDFFE